MANMTAQDVISTQREEWTRVAPGWEKWDAVFDRNLSFINYRLVAEARLRPGFRVLDLGSGTGYPALLAAQAVTPEGSVVGLDLSEAMLTVARRKAKEQGLSNVEFMAADACAIDLGDASFDAVTSRFCLMFLPDIQKAVRDIARVLKPGGYLAAAVWSAPEKNPMTSAPMGVLKKMLSLPTPDPDQPGIFRLAKPGDLRGTMESAGLDTIVEDETVGESFYASADEYFEALMEIAAPLQTLFAKLSTEQKAGAEAEIKQAVSKFRRNGHLALPMAVRVVSGRKPIS
ncbi:MAG: methyltransferase domain-containing protein [Nitrospirae bacterium]|nr:methyltransferase domain-containing protein [Nitrospirota bacterium]